METCSNYFVIFKIDEQHYALSLLNVERVVRAVQITSIPSKQKYVLGVVDVQGNVTPVLNTRNLLDAPDKEIDLSDQFIISKNSNRKVILVVDSVPGVSELFGEEDRPIIVRSESSGLVQDIARFGDSLVLVINVEFLFSIIDDNNSSSLPVRPN